MPVEVRAEVDPGSAFGSVDDFSSLIEEVAESDALGSALPDSGLEIEAEAALGDSSGLELAGDPPANTEESDAEPGDPEALGDPEDWNFFSDTTSSGYQPPPVATSPTLEDSSSHPTAADAVGRSRSAVTNLLRLLNLAKPVQAMVLEQTAGVKKVG